MVACLQKFRTKSPKATDFQPLFAYIFSNNVSVFDFTSVSIEPFGTKIFFEIKEANMSAANESQSLYQSLNLIISLPLHRDRHSKYTRT